MHWNHRVVRTTRAGQRRLRPGAPEQFESTIFDVRDTFYGLDGPGSIGIILDAAVPMGETLAELREDLTRMLAALEHPVLDGDADPIVELAEPLTRSPLAVCAGDPDPSEATRHE